MQEYLVSIYVSFCPPFVSSVVWDSTAYIFLTSHIVVAAAAAATAADIIVVDGFAVVTVAAAVTAVYACCWCKFCFGCYCYLIWWGGNRALGPRMSDDILRTNCDQCRSTVQCCFTSTETVRLVRTESPGWPPRLSHSTWTLLSYILPIYFYSGLDSVWQVVLGV